MHELKWSLRPVRELYGQTLAAEFGPRSLAAVRQHMIGLGWCRTLINRRIDRVKRAFKWATAEELVPVAVFRHPRHQIVLFALSKALYFGLALAVPLAVLPLPWWQVVLGYLGVTAGASLLFVFLLVGTHFSDETDFPAPDAGGNLDRTWAEHNLATACDWSPENWWAHFFSGGVNAHAAHHLFPRVCHTHYRAIARIIIEVTEEFGVAYNRTTAAGMVRSHFAFLRKMGRKPDAGDPRVVAARIAVPVARQAAPVPIGPGTRQRG